MLWNQSNIQGQSEGREIPLRANMNSKENRPNCPRRGKTRATKSWLVLVFVLHLIGWDSGASFQDQSQSEVRAKPKLFKIFSDTPCPKHVISPYYMNTLSSKKVMLTHKRINLTLLSWYHPNSLNSFIRIWREVARESCLLVYGRSRVYYLRFIFSQVS